MWLGFVFLEIPCLANRTLVWWWVQCEINLEWKKNKNTCSMNKCANHMGNNMAIWPGTPFRHSSTTGTQNVNIGKIVGQSFIWPIQSSMIKQAFLRYAGFQFEKNFIVHLVWYCLATFSLLAHLGVPLIL